MLKSLNIKNYAIIDDLTIDFDHGFNVFTGETGAGKSIIVGALSFLLKGRSDSSIIKTGKEKAIIEGVFDIKDEEVLNLLKEQDIDVDDEIIVKRIISNDNHNSIKINQTSVTLNFLTNLFSKYIDIHSQKDNHFLFDKKNQLSLIDKYADNSSLLNKYEEKYLVYTKLINELNELKNNTYNEREIEFYKYDLNEIKEANLSIDEEIELESKEKRLKDSEKYTKTLSEAINYYDDNYGVKENLYNLFNSLNLDDEKIIDIKEKIQDIYYSLDEQVDSLKDILSTFIDDDMSLDQIEERLYIYSKLKRKHKTDVNGILNIKKELEDKIAVYDDQDNILNEKQKEIDFAFNEANDLACQIHEKRIVAAKQLSEKVINEGKDLLLNNINFEIEFNEIDLNSKGKDEIEFLVSLNKGEELKPLRNVASGGEISRLMLALKVVFASISNSGLLILDEIDTGVSGKVALAVGEKIAKIAKSCQVLCISHLAPVAACAKTHFLIYKEDNDSYTYTNVKKLNLEETIKELAIISNTSTDQKALEAAKQLFESSQKLVNEN